MRSIGRRPILRARAMFAGIVALSSPAFAHDRLYELHDWRNGLGNATVQGVAQDPDGFIWVATSSCLLRFDGSEFRRVTQRNSFLLPDHSAASPVYLYSDNALEVVRDGKPVAVTGDDGAPVRVERAWIAVAEDGALWIVDERGAHCTRLDGTRGSFGGVTRDGACRPICAGPAADIYAWRAGELLRVSPSGSTRAIVRIDEPVVALETPRGDVIAALADGTIVRASSDARRELGAHFGRPCDLVARGDAVFASFDSGLYRVGSDDSIERIGSLGEIPSGAALLVDRESNVWMATGSVGAGLFMFPELETLKLSHERNLFARSVTVVGGEPWFGGWWGPFRAVASGNGWRVHEIKDCGGWSMPCADANGCVWIAQPDVFIAWRADARVRTVRAPGVAASHRATRCTSGGVWIPANDGLYRIEADGAEPRRVLEQFPGARDDDLQSASTWRAFETRDGVLHLALGARTACGPAADVLRGAPVNWTCDELPAGESITGFGELPGLGVLAAVFGRGVHRWDGTHWRLVESIDALRMDQTARGIVAGEDDTLWLLLEQDIVRIGARADRRAGYEIVERLSPRHGLPGTRVEDLAPDGSGGLWLVMQTTAVHMPAAARWRERPSAELQLIEAAVDGEAIDLGAPIELSRSRNRLQLRFAALSYTERAAMRFRLRLRPGDPWEPPTTEPAFRFVDLPSGDYDVEAQASIDGVRWREPGAGLSFRVLRPWYLQAWFVLLALAVLSATAFAWHRLRVATLLRLERQRARIAMDLHDEIGAGLGGIGLMAELAARASTSSERRTELAARVSETAARLSGSLQDIVWSLRPGATRLESLAAHIVERAHALFADGEPELVVDIPERLPDVSISLHVRRDVLLIAQEALHNARRHAHARRVHVQLAPSGRRWTLSVRDDGRGLPESGAPSSPATSSAGTSSTARGLGLASMRARARRLDAELRVEAAAGGGTLVVLVFDPDADARSAHEEPA